MDFGELSLICWLVYRHYVCGGRFAVHGHHADCFPRAGKGWHRTNQRGYAPPMVAAICHAQSSRNGLSQVARLRHALTNLVARFITAARPTNVELFCLGLKVTSPRSIKAKSNLTYVDLDTNNVVNDEHPGEGYTHIVEYIPIGHPTPATLSKIAALTPSTHYGDREHPSPLPISHPEPV